MRFKKFVEERTIKEIKGVDSGFGQAGTFEEGNKVGKINKKTVRKYSSYEKRVNVLNAVIKFTD